MIIAYCLEVIAFACVSSYGRTLNAMPKKVVSLAEVKRKQIIAQYVKFYGTSPIKSTITHARRRQVRRRPSVNDSKCWR
jgi:hypothetical protein